MSAVGKWKLAESDKNWDKFLEKLGIGMLKRSAAKLSTPVLTVTNDGDSWTVLTEALKNSTMTFKSGEPFQEERQDGKTVTSVITIDGNTWKQVQTDTDGPEVKIDRVFAGDVLTATASVADVTSIRTYKRV